jgi:translation initiation factor IF-2
VKYLQRAARRPTTVGASDGATSMRPAIPSRSPIAEADQRLNLDSFAERLNAPLVPEPTAPMIEEEEAAATPAPERQPEKRQEAARPPSSDARPASPAPRPGAHGEPTRAERAGTGRRAIPPHAPKRPGTHAGPPAQRSAHGHPEAPAAPLHPSDRPARRANALPAPAADRGRAPAPERAHAASARVTGGARPPARDEDAQPMLDALSHAMSWVEGQPHRRPERERVEEQGTPAAIALPPSGESSAARPARAAARGRAPVTHLEIGRIEVEIVPPPKPAPQAAPHRPAPRKNGGGSALRQPFGWRQR